MNCQKQPSQFHIDSLNQNPFHVHTYGVFYYQSQYNTTSSDPTKNQKVNHEKDNSLMNDNTHSVPQTASEPASQPIISSSYSVATSRVTTVAMHVYKHLYGDVVTEMCHSNEFLLYRKCTVIIIDSKACRHVSGK